MDWLETLSLHALLVMCYSFPEKTLHFLLIALISISKSSLFIHGGRDLNPNSIHRTTEAVIDRIYM